MEGLQQDYLRRMNERKAAPRQQNRNLSAEQQELVRHVRDIDVQLDQLAFKHTQTVGSKNYFTDLLTKSVSENSKEEVSSE
mgnify:CR=1 FL=1